MMQNDTRLIPNNAFTHAGSFHADDVFSAALLRLLNPEIKFERGFKVPDAFSGIVFDIGFGEFDHHQNDNEVRENGIPYASFGKLWQAFGYRLVGEESVNFIDETFIQKLDLSDNTGTPSEIANIIDLLNPSWTEQNPDTDKYFEKAVQMATTILENVIIQEKDRKLATQIAENAILNAKCKEIIILPQYAPVINMLIDTDAKFVIYPSNRGGFMARVIPKAHDTQEAKIDFPKEWGGHREELSNINNIEDMTFCHSTLFCCSAQSLESTIKCAVLALNNETVYDKKFDEGVKYILSGIQKQQER